MAACTAALPLLDQTPGNWTDPEMAALTLTYLTAQRDAWRMCAQGDFIAANPLQETATQAMKALTVRLGQLN